MDLKVCNQIKSVNSLTLPHENYDFGIIGKLILICIYYSEILGANYVSLMNKKVSDFCKKRGHAESSHIWTVLNFQTAARDFTLNLELTELFGRWTSMESRKYHMNI